MDPNRCFKFLLLFVFSVYSISANDSIYDELLQRLEATEDTVKALSSRVDLLESREKMYQVRIADLETRDRKQQQLIDKLVQKLKGDSEAVDPLVEVVKDNTRHNLSFNDAIRSIVNEQSDMESEGPKPRAKIGRAVRRIRQAEMESPVAFFALFGQHLNHAGLNQVFVFDHVVTNLGNSYNNHTGYFTAPIEGVYVFSTTLVSRYHVSGHSSFYWNSNKVNTMYVSGAEGGYDTTGSTIILQLQKGDIVSVHNGDSDVSYNGFDHSSFSGFLLSTFMQVPSIVGK